MLIMLPWDKIDAAAYTVWDKTANFNKAISNSKERIAHNEQFKLIEDNGLIVEVRKVPIV
jgi:carboxyl-terminal processing protease